MAYENPYANTMNYVPSTLWEHPEPYKTDWSTFWGKADEDDDDKKDKDDGRGDETGVEKGAGSQLKSLWGDVMADIQANFQEGYNLQQSQNMFDSVFGPGITATNAAQTVPDTTDYVNGWQNPNYTGLPVVTDFITDVSLPANTGGNTQAQAVTQGLASSNVQPSEVIQEYQPSYEQQQQDLIDQSTQAYNQQFGQNALNQATVIGDAGQLSATSGGPFTPAQSLGLMDPQIAQDLMRSRTFDTTAAATRGLLEGTDAEIDFDAVTDDERDWGDFW